VFVSDIFGNDWRQLVEQRVDMERKFLEHSLLSMERKFQGCESFMERKFLEHSLLRSESSTGAKVPWKESSWTFRSPGANVPRNESSLYGLFAPGNESAEERKGQLPMDSRHLTTLFSVPQGWTVNIILCYFPSLRYLTFTRG